MGKVMAHHVVLAKAIVRDSRGALEALYCDTTVHPLADVLTRPRPTPAHLMWASLMTDPNELPDEYSDEDDTLEEDALLTSQPGITSADEYLSVWADAINCTEDKQ